MFLSASVVTQVWKKKPLARVHNDKSALSTYLDPTDLVLDEVNDEAISNLATS